MASPPETNPRVLRGGNASISVLFVDDDKDYVDLAIRFLKSGCIEVVDGVTSAVEALKRLHTKTYDVVICDYLMPEMDGVQLLKRMRAEGDETPFVLMTGKDREDVDFDPFEIGADLRVRKTGDMRERFTELSEMIRDLACWKHAEKQLRTERDLCKYLVDSNMIGLLVLDRERNVVIWNRGLALITGIQEDAVLGRPLPIDSSPILRSLISRADVDRLMNGGMKPSTLSTWVDPENGSERHFEVALFPIPGGDEGPQAGLIHVIDVTQRIKTAEELERSEKRYRLLVELADEGIWSVDREDRINFANPKMAEMMARDAKELTGRHISEFVADEDKELATEALRLCREGSDVVLDLEFSNLAGERQMVSFKASPMFDSDGAYVGAVAMFTDLASRKRAEEALRAANEKLALMGSITRHDVINQIGILSGYLSLIEGDVSDVKTMNQYFAAAKKACSTITEQLQFAGSYQKAGTKEPEWTRVRLEFAGSASTVDMEDIEVEESVGGLEILADPMFEKVFLNLLLNTRRHGEKATKVQVSCMQNGDDMVIVYSDDGVGIPVDEKEKIFGRGYGKDSGLGLFLIREVLAITGITIVETGEPGKGARFEITVPKGNFRFSKGWKTDARAGEGI